MLNYIKKKNNLIHITAIINWKKISIGKNNIIGRSVIVHDLKDDLGKGKNKESLKTGNAGARLNCAKILKSK